MPSSKHDTDFAHRAVCCRSAAPAYQLSAVCASGGLQPQIWNHITNFRAITDDGFLIGLFAAAVPLPPAGAPRSVHRAAQRDRVIELAEMEAAGISSVTQAADLRPVERALAAGAAEGAVTTGSACSLPSADSTASSLCVPYAGGWLKGVDFGCRWSRSPHTPCPRSLSVPLVFFASVPLSRFCTFFPQAPTSSIDALTQTGFVSSCSLVCKWKHHH